MSWKSDEEDELKAHVTNLKEENEHLQAELLSLITQNKMKQDN